MNSGGVNWLLILFIDIKLGTIHRCSNPAILLHSFGKYWNV